MECFIKENVLKKCKKIRKILYNFDLKDMNKNPIYPIKYKLQKQKDSIIYHGLLKIQKCINVILEIKKNLFFIAREKKKSCEIVELFENENNKQI